jgi:16S rRNA (adenine1518-N6/adenine1519-N6)-dimethyltransferase
MLQYSFNMERLFVVPPGAFNPAPKVDSAIVRLLPRQMEADAKALDEALFSRVVTAAFSQRRKMLRNTLRELIAEDDLTVLGIAPTARAEQLTVADYLRITNALAREN